MEEVQQLLSIIAYPLGFSIRFSGTKTFFHNTFTIFDSQIKIFLHGFNRQLSQRSKKWIKCLWCFLIRSCPSKMDVKLKNKYCWERCEGQVVVLCNRRIKNYFKMKYKRQRLNSNYIHLKCSTKLISVLKIYFSKK